MKQRNRHWCGAGIHAGANVALVGGWLWFTATACFGADAGAKPGLTHAFLATGAETRIVDAAGQVVWRYPLSTRDGWVLPKGRNAKSELEAVRSSWQGDFRVEPSLTDEDAGIIVAQGVRRRAKGDNSR